MCTEWLKRTEGKTHTYTKVRITAVQQQTRALARLTPTISGVVKESLLLEEQ